MAPLRPSHREAVAAASREVLAQVARRPWAEEFYLAGSAALALYLGHRHVQDLDLMSASSRLGGPERRDLLADLAQLDPQVQVETARDGYLFSRHASGPALKLFYYPYPLVGPQTELDGIAVASPVDLGLMKLGAIISRGNRRDFVDLYLLCRHLPLRSLLERSQEKYGHVRDFPLQALKGLADDSGMEGEPMPRLLEELSWQEVQQWVDGEVRRLGREWVGLDRR